MSIINLHIDQIIALCRKFHVSKLWVFGSVLTSRFNEKSDIDLLVDFNKNEIPLHDYSNNFFGFQFALEELLGRDIDITEERAVRNSFFRAELDATKTLLYG